MSTKPRGILKAAKPRGTLKGENPRGILKGAHSIPSRVTEDQSFLVPPQFQNEENTIIIVPYGFDQSVPILVQ